MSTARHPLEIAQFVTGDAARIAGASEKAVALLISPGGGLLKLRGRNANPGLGRRRMLSGFDVLMISTVFTTTAVGFPQRLASRVAEEVANRAEHLAAGVGEVEGYAIHMWPVPGVDDWACVSTWTGGPDVDLPEGYHTIQVDKLIARVVAQLVAILDDAEFPETVPPIPAYPWPKLLAGPWARDKEGRKVLAGLTHEETREIAGLMGKTNPSALKRFQQLDDKRKRATEEGGA